jgi:predicted N-formylglutamate amidohydrolase
LLLGDTDPAPVVVEGEGRSSPFFLICEHAGNRIPAALGDLGLSPEDRQRHIAWDPGAEPMARAAAETLDATLVIQPYSRLVIDCNRPPRSGESIWTVSESTVIPGNEGLTHEQAMARVEEVFEPFHRRIAELLDARDKAGRETIVVTIHSFTPVYNGFVRPWHAGAQYNRNPEFSHLVNAALAEDEALCVGDNQPYPVNDDTHYTIPFHGEKRGVPHCMIEVRQDLLATAADQAAWGRRLAEILARAREQYRDRFTLDGLARARSTSSVAR